jgi:glycerophosphoryl diester phosphodiesterase
MKRFIYFKGQVDPKQAAETKQAISEELQGAQARLQKLEKGSKEKIIGERTKEELDDYKEIMDFYEGIFGKTFIAGFFTSITTWLAGESGEFDPKRFEEELNKQARELAERDLNVAEYTAAHRALGYGRHRENSPEALKAALDNGENQIELDLRKGKDGEVYLSHDSISKVSDPEKSCFSLEKALHMIASHSNNDSVIFFDIKEPGIIRKLKEILDQNPSMKNRFFIMAHDEKILEETSVFKENPPPLIFYYFPTGKYSLLTGIVEKIGMGPIRSILRKVDAITGGSTAKGLEHTRIKLDGKELEEPGLKADKTYHMYSGLPDKKIISRIRASNGYICVPAPLVTRELVAKIKGEGVKVAVWGAEDERIKQMIFDLGVDFVISDTPKQQGISA